MESDIMEDIQRIESKVHVKDKASDTRTGRGRHRPGYWIGHTKIQQTRRQVMMLMSEEEAVIRCHQGSGYTGTGVKYVSREHVPQNRCVREHGVRFGHEYQSYRTYPM